MQTFAVDSELGPVVAALRSKSQVGVRRASDPVSHSARLKTGILILDLALAGGIPFSRTIAFYGEKSAGKTTLSLITAGRMQKRFPDSYVAWLDIEGSIDLNWAIKLGIDPDRLLVVEPPTGESAIDAADALLRTKEVSMLVTDSIAFLQPMAEIEESAEKQFMGAQPRLIGKYIRKINSALLAERSRGHIPIVLHINQYRMKVGLVFGDPRTMPGGKIMTYVTSQEVEPKNKEHKGKDEHGNEIVIWNEHEFEVKKDKTGGRLKAGAFAIIRDSKATGLPEGYVRQTKTILEFGRNIGIVRGQAGKPYIDGMGQFNSVDNVTHAFIEHPDRQELLMSRILDDYRKRWDVS